MLQYTRKVKPKLTCLIFAIVLGILMAVGGYTLGFNILPEIVKNKIWEGAVLSENTSQWNVFLKIPFAFKFKVYLFNITNAESVLQGEKPVVQEIGPYVYRNFKWKTSVTWTTDEQVSYRNREHFEFDKRESGNLSDTDMIMTLNTMLNSALQTTASKNPDALPILYSALPTVFHGYDSLFFKAMVKDDLFEGTQICNTDNIANNKESKFAVSAVCSQMRIVARTGKSTRFGEKSLLFAYFSDKNLSESGWHTIRSGKCSKENLGVLTLYQNKSHLEIWGDPQNRCNQLRSSTIFTPFVSRNSSYRLFSEDMCRTIVMEYVQDQYVDGILGYYFQLRNDTFLSSSESMENECFCDNKTVDMDGSYSCLGSGFINLQNCKGGPMLFSFPHLLWADKRYSDTVIGLQPDENKHVSYVVLEPYTGTVLKSGKRIQFNMFIHAIEGIPFMENVTEGVIPILWLDETMQLPDKYLNRIKEELLAKLNTIEKLKWSMIGFGILITLLSVGMIIHYY